MSEMSEEDELDAVTFARHHAGEEESDLTPAQRDLLGRVIAKRIAQGQKLRLIERAAVRALAELGDERARKLAHDETLRAFGHEQLASLRKRGATRVAVSTAQDACAECQATAGNYPLDAAPRLPNRDCTHPGGCRCLYAPVSEG